MPNPPDHRDVLTTQRSIPSELPRNEWEVISWAQPTPEEEDLAEFLLFQIARFSDHGDACVEGRVDGFGGCLVDTTFDAIRVVRALMERLSAGSLPERAKSTHIEELEVTPDMIEAGVTEYYAFNSDFELPADFVSRVYREMEQARQLSRP